VPYVNEAGETIVKEYIYQPPHRDPVVISVKAQPSKPAKVPQVAPQTPLTFQSPLHPDDYTSTLYLPAVMGVRPMQRCW
jgi:hypothetical protein